MIGGKEKIEKLRMEGVEISIDDFGTGYSSLKYLSDIHVNYLKIDISFIRKMTEDEKILNLVKSIINIAKIFNIKTIAEGVETIEQYNILKELGCDKYQGYYFSPAIPVSEFEKFLKKEV